MKRLRRQQLQILDPVVVSYLVAMVHHFPMVDRPSYGRFNHKMRAANIPAFVCSWVIWLKQQHIPFALLLTALPSISLIAGWLGPLAMPIDKTMALEPYGLTTSAHATCNHVTV